MTKAQVLAAYGPPSSVLAIVAAGGGTGELDTWQVHGGLLYVTFVNGLVVAIETDSSYYRTSGGAGPGHGGPPGPPFHREVCSFGLSDEQPGGDVSTTFEADG